MGSVTPYETSGGRRYRVRYRKPDHSQTDKRGFRTKRDAEMFLASVEVAKNTGRYIDPSRGRVTIAQWMTSWIESRSDLRPSTLDRVQGVIRIHIIPTIGHLALSDFSRLQAQQWASKLRRRARARCARSSTSCRAGCSSPSMTGGFRPIPQRG